MEQERQTPEQQKFQFEREKFKEELRTERIKTLATAFSIIIPVIIAGWTINSNMDLQADKAKYDFSLKAADYIMSAKTPAGIEARAKILRDMFPDYINKGFLRDFNSTEYSASEATIIRERKDKLLQILVDSGLLSATELIDWWKKLYPEDTWIDEANITIIAPEDRSVPYSIRLASSQTL